MKSRMTSIGWEILREGTPKARYVIESGATPREQLEAELANLQDVPPEEIERRYRELGEGESAPEIEGLTTAELIRKYKDLL